MIYDRYTTGVWYDAECDSFTRIDYDDDANEIVFTDPDDGGELERIDGENFDAGDLYQIPEFVVNNPAAFLTDRLERVIDGYFSQSENNYSTFREEVSVQYAMEHCEIIESE